MRYDFNIKPHDKAGYVFITGTPRCGTQYIARCFQAIGIDIQHEAFGKRGIAAFYIVSFLAERKEGLVLHQVREPLKVIASMQTIKPKTWQLITNNTGIEPKPGDLTHAIMRLYLHLNSEIEKYYYFRYRIEDIDTVWLQLLNIMELPDQPLPDIPRNTHTRKGRFEPLSWTELESRDVELTKRIKDMAIRHGYEVES